MSLHSHKIKKKLSTNKHSYLIQHAALLNNVASSTYVIQKQRKRIKNFQVHVKVALQDSIDEGQ
jgi:hypothetical protein